MKELLGQYYGMVLIGMMTGIGLTARLILLGFYSGLGKACRMFQSTKNKTVRYLREDLERRALQESEPRNKAVYTECRLAERKIAGVRLGSWESLADRSVFLLALAGVLPLLWDIMWGKAEKDCLMPLFVSGLAAFGLLLLDMLLGVHEKQRRVRLIVKDCIENGVIPKDGKCIKTEKTKDKQRKKNGKAQEEKRRLTEELLRERRQLEARRFAEQRKIEQIEEIPAVQAEAEVAVAVTEPVVSEATDATPEGKMTAGNGGTGESYESLLSEVLKEYLA